MNKPLTYSELDELKKTDTLTFCYNEDIYKCDLSTLPISQATEWLCKASSTYKYKRQPDKSRDIKSWLDKAKKYQEVLGIFYPPMVSCVTLNIIKYLRESNCLDVATIEECRERLVAYWTEKSLSDPKTLTLTEVIDIGRAIKTLGLETAEYREFIEVFDMELYSGSSATRFNTLFTYLKKASKAFWMYNDRDWPLIQSSIGEWRSWYFKVTSSFEQVEHLLRKYLGIDNVHYFFKEHIWVSQTKPLEIESPYYESMFTSYQLQRDNLGLDYVEYFKVLGITSRTSFKEARRAYLQKAWVYHPDQSETADEEKLKVVTVAWNILRDNFYKTKL